MLSRALNGARSNALDGGLVVTLELPMLEMTPDTAGVELPLMVRAT